MRIVHYLSMCLALLCADMVNQLTAWAGASLLYDANGNMTSDGSNTYTWDSRQRLSTLAGTTSGSFRYDAANRRSQKTIAGQTTGYVFDGINLVQELTGAVPPPTVQANLLTGGLDEIFSRTEASGSTYSYLVDALGSTQALTDSSGAFTTQYTYDPYGQTSSSGSASANRQQYTGRENDGTGLYYYRARYYSPGFGRFISGDPIGLAGGINTYAYVNGSPTSNVDQLGLATVVIRSGSIDSNPFGHVAIATTGGGIFSYGTRDAYGASFSDYLDTQSNRFMEINIFDTTPEQEAAIQASIRTNLTQDYSVSSHNCSTAVGDALNSAGLTSREPSIFPGQVFAETLNLPGSKYIYIRPGGTPPSILKQLDPK
jgi:RHS repeat-associated protein